MPLVVRGDLTAHCTLHIIILSHVQVWVSFFLCRYECNYLPLRSGQGCKCTLFNCHDDDNVFMRAAGDEWTCGYRWPWVRESWVKWARRGRRQKMLTVLRSRWCTISSQGLQRPFNDFWSLCTIFTRVWFVWGGKLITFIISYTFIVIWSEPVKIRASTHTHADWCISQEGLLVTRVNSECILMQSKHQKQMCFCFSQANQVSSLFSLVFSSLSSHTHTRIHMSSFCCACIVPCFVFFFFFSLPPRIHVFRRQWMFDASKHKTQLRRVLIITQEEMRFSPLLFSLPSSRLSFSCASFIHFTGCT